MLNTSLGTRLPCVCVCHRWHGSRYTAPRACLAASSVCQPTGPTISRSCLLACVCALQVQTWSNGVAHADLPMRLGAAEEAEYAQLARAVLERCSNAGLSAGRLALRVKAAA
jgi:hypothetical protein